MTSVHVAHAPIVVRDTMSLRALVMQLDHRHPSNRRLCPMMQVHPDFAPRAPSGPGGDSFGRPPSSTAVLAARTRDSSHAGRPGPSNAAPSIQASAPGSGARAAAPSAPANQSQGGSGGGKMTGEGAATVKTLPTLPVSGSLDAEQQGRQPQGFSHPSSTDRLWTRFSVLALDPPSTSELRSVFSHVFSDAFAGDGPISSAIYSSPSDDATTKATSIITSEVWKAVDAMGSVAAEFLDRLHERLLKETSPSRSTFAAGGAGAAGGATTAPLRVGFQRDSLVDIAACRLDFFTLGRLLRPLVLGRTGGISTPAAVQSFFCHEVKL